MLHNDIIYDFNGKTKPSSPIFFNYEKEGLYQKYLTALIFKITIDIL